jgi:HJR/Mrr/RecB family endonuclease
MQGGQFEKFICQLMIRMGYSAEVTKASGDQGIDVLAQKNGEKYGVQAKRYTSSVGNAAVQEVIAGMTFYNCEHGIVITNSNFTKSAFNLANKADIKLIDREELTELIARYF